MAAASLLARSGGALIIYSTLARRTVPATAIPSSSSPQSLHLRRICRRPPPLPSPRKTARFLCCAPQSDQTVALDDAPAAPVSDTAEASSPDSPPPEPSPEDLAREAAGLLDIRVGRVLRAWRHPEADSLYVEEVDVGEPEPRTICSGLVKYVPLDQLQETNVVVLANLKPRNMRGVKSNGMLMAASDAAHENVELLAPSEGSVPGERIWFGSKEDKSRQVEAATPNQVQKKKIWESVQPHLKTTETCEAGLLGVHPMRTSAGVVSCKSLKNANIS